MADQTATLSAQRPTPNIWDRDSRKSIHPMSFGRMNGVWGCLTPAPHLCQAHFLNEFYLLSRIVSVGSILALAKTSRL